MTASTQSLICPTATEDSSGSVLPAPQSPPQPPPQSPPPRPGLYGARGWTVRLGLWTLLSRFPDELRPVPPACAGGPSTSLLDGAGAPVSDYVPFAGLDAQAATDLLAVLSEDALQDRQNQAPTLRALLRACAQGGGRVRLCGYGIGPQRHDERLSVEGLWVSDPGLAGFEVSPTHAPGCGCQGLWARVSQRYQLDAEGAPDELRRLCPTWAGGQDGWWFWWD